MGPVKLGGPVAAGDLTCGCADSGEARSLIPFQGTSRSRRAGPRRFDCREGVGNWGGGLSFVNRGQSQGRVLTNGTLLANDPRFIPAAPPRPLGTDPCGALAQSNHRLFLSVNSLCSVS